MSDGTNKATQEYWDRAYKGTQPFAAPRGHIVRRWLEAHVPHTDTGCALEIGCYPGRFLSVLGEMGYEVNGVDLAAGVEGMSAWMESRGFRTGMISRGDFFELEPGRRFDVVMSLGFIEHFTHWEDVLERHERLVAPGGLLVLQAPNFVGKFQNRVHRTFDAGNLSHHHLPAMNPSAWASRLHDNGFEIQFEGFFGPLYFWVEPQERGAVQRAGLFLLRAACKILRPLVPAGNPHYAPYCGVVARRKA